MCVYPYKNLFADRLGNFALALAPLLPSACIFSRHDIFLAALQNIVYFCSMVIDTCHNADSTTID